jgi:hypothetical protein
MMRGIRDSAMIVSLLLHFDASSSSPGKKNPTRLIGSGWVLMPLEAVYFDPLIHTPMLGHSNSSGRAWRSC